MKSKKIFHYYIDESGGINNNDPVFLFGCIKTDTPDLSNYAIQELKDKLKDELDFLPFLERIEKGFHACSDHPDIMTKFYEILPFLNFRAYFEVIIKKGDFYNELKKKNRDFEIISKMLENLIRRMILKNPDDKHLFYVEELDVSEKSLKKILDEIESKYVSKIDLKIEIIPKGNNNLEIPDYVNNNLFAIFEPDEKKFISNERKQGRFNNLRDKIALIHIWNNDSFYSRKGKTEKQIEIDNLRKVMAEV